MDIDILPVEKTISGIYKIINKINGKFYIGSSKNIIKRLKQHINALNNNKHINRHLQGAWNQYGYKNFEYDILLCVLNQSKLFEIEQKFLDNTKCYDDSIGYNISKFVDKPPKYIMSDEQKISYSIRFSGNKNPFYGKKHSEETKNKLSIKNKEYYKNHDHPLKNRKFTQKQIEKCKIQNKGSNNPMYGRKHSESTKEKMRLNSNPHMRGKKTSNIVKNKISKANGMAVLCIQTNAIFYSLRSAAKFAKTNHHRIKSAIDNNFNVNGYTFKKVG